MLVRPPEISQDDYQGLYDYYDQNEIDGAIFEGLIANVTREYQPQTVFLDGAEEQTRSLSEQGYQFVFNMWHLLEDDQNSVLASMATTPALTTFAGQTHIFSKPEYFQTNDETRQFLDGLGVIPIFREQDLPDEMDALSKGRIAVRGLESGIARLRAGKNLAAFWGGTRKDREPLYEVEEGDVQGGMPWLVCKAAREPEIKLATIAIGIYYGDDPATRRTNPTICFGNPRTEPFVNKKEVQAIARADMQSAINGALGALVFDR